MYEETCKYIVFRCFCIITLNTLFSKFTDFSCPKYQYCARPYYCTSGFLKVLIFGIRKIVLLLSTGSANIFFLKKQFSDHLLNEIYTYRGLCMMRSCCDLITITVMSSDLDIREPWGIFWEISCHFQTN